MPHSSKFALRAWQSIQQPGRSQCKAALRRQCLLSESRSRASSRRTFYTRTSSFAQAAAAKPATASAGAAATENAFSSGPSTPQASPLPLNESDPTRIDWSKSFHGLSQEAFPKEAADVLLAPVEPDAVEIKPDGIIYMPEIWYRRTLNKAFGPGAWGLAPRGETIVTDKAVTREYALVAHGRLVHLKPPAIQKAMVLTCRQTCFDSSRRTRLLLQRWDTNSQRRLQIQRYGPLLQGSGHSLGALGPTIHQRLEREACKRGIRGASG